MIFFHDPEQKAAAKTSKEKLQSSGKFNKKIVAEIAPASQFYRAEDYDQQYLEKFGQGCCGLPPREEHRPLAPDRRRE